MHDALKMRAAGRADSIDAREKYRITKKKTIVQTLSMLAQKRCLVTAQFTDSKSSLLTLILGVLKDKDLLILDYGPNESTNKKILDATSIKFASQCGGVKAGFAAKKILKAKYQGQPVFVLPIPEALLWLQRRESFRVKVPRSDPVRCRIGFDGEERDGYPVLDIGVGGVGIVDSQFSFGANQGDVGSQLKNCNLRIPGSGEHVVTLEVMYLAQINTHNRFEGQRVGCALRELNHAVETEIQHYMHRIELQRRRASNNKPEIGS